jgi:hypothetical protein
MISFSWLGSNLTSAIFPTYISAPPKPSSPLRPATVLFLFLILFSLLIYYLIFMANGARRGLIGGLHIYRLFSHRHVDPVAVAVRLSEDPILYERGSCFVVVT